jgi:DNA-binding beta-propeller fold protein YncE
MRAHRRSLAALVVMALFDFFACHAEAQLISLSTRKSHVFDPVSRNLYITTSSGNVERYNLATNSFLAPWSLGGTLGGIDVTPNGATIVVADSTYNVNTDLGNVRRVDAATGLPSTHTFPIYGGQS